MVFKETDTEILKEAGSSAHVRAYLRIHTIDKYYSLERTSPKHRKNTSKMYRLYTVVSYNL